MPTFRRFLVPCIALLLLFHPIVADGQTAPASGVSSADRLHADALRFQGKHVKVTMNDGASLKGTLVSATDSSLVLQPDKRSASPMTIEFAKINSVRGAMRTSSKWAIGLGIWAALGVVSSRL